MNEATMRHRTSPRVARRRTHALREGITVGLIGAAIVMPWFFIVDLAAGVPLRTPRTPRRRALRRRAVRSGDSAFQQRSYPAVTATG